MSKTVTIGKRYLNDDRWHDDNGPLPDYPGAWDPPMTEAEKYEAALADPDAQPLTAEQLARPPRRVPRSRFIRRKFGLTQEQFAERYGIPLATLQDWEAYRATPDPAMLAYLKVIERMPEAVAEALAPETV